MDKKNIQDIYKLTPLQEGILFHSINSPKSGVYIEQFVRVAARLDVSQWEQAWNTVIENNDILRTAYFWEGLEKPVQVVKKTSAHTITEIDWSALGKDELESRFSDFLAEDKVKDFDFNSGSLLRQTVIHISDKESYFVWSYHHILLDGWSAFLVMDEVFSAYESIVSGTTYSVPERPPFKKYVQWLQLQDKKKDESFWRDYLKGFSSTTPLGLLENPDYDASHESNHYITQLNDLDDALSKKVDEFSRKHRVTVNTLIQAAWGYTLGIYSGENDVVFGSTVSGRPVDLEASQKMVGLFINTLPTRVQIQPHQRIGDWLAEIQEQQLQVREYEHSALTDIQGWSQVGRAQPLFDSMLAVESFPASKYVDLPDVQVAQKTNYPLTFVVVPGRKISIKAMFDADRYRPEVVSNLVDHIVNALNYMCDFPEQSVGNISLMNAQALAQMNRWNDTNSAYSSDKQLEDFFKHFASKTPDATAVVVAGETFSYGQLNARANQIANYLLDKGVSINDEVAILLDPSFDMIASIIAITQCGCAYAPLDSLAPKARLDGMIADLNIKTVVTHKGIANELDMQQCNFIDLNTDEGRVIQCDTEFQRISRPHNNLIYVIHTSGSTGKPKAAGVFHHSFLNFMEYWNGDFAFSANDKVLLVNKVTFDLSQKNIWGALMTGGELHLSTDKYFDPESARKQIAENRITWMNCTPSMAYAIIEVDKEQYADMGSMRQLFVGGEPVNKERIAPWILSSSCRGRLINTYGPTECTDLCGTHKFEKEEFIQLSKPVTVGKALPNIRMYIFDRFNNPLPEGVAGEVIIGGISIGSGYLNNAGMTAEKFFPNPFEGEPYSDRLYRTGDLGYFQQDGSVVVKGRVDFQVKLRGYRIELAEIDTYIQTLSWINDSVTVVKGTDNQQLVSYIVLDNAPAEHNEAIKKHLAETLPEYMVPNIYVALDALPLNDNGKVNRSALPEPDAALMTEKERVFVASNATEEKLLSIWKKVLNREDVAIEDNFFELGGHSLTITQICSRIRKEFKIAIQLSELFDLLTIRDQARFIDQSDNQNTAEINVPEKMTRTDQVPLSFAQSRLWFLHQFEPGNIAYNVPNVLRFNQPLNCEVLEQTLECISQRHDSLRSYFPSVDGMPVQVVRKQQTLNIVYTDVRELNDEESEREIGVIATNEAKTEFDITQDVLVRFSCVATAENNFLLFVTMHHIITDGWSMDIFTREVQQTYQALLDRKTPELPDIELDYIDYSLWQAKQLQENKLDGQINTLAEYLQGSSNTITLPYDAARPLEKSYQGGIIKSKIGGDVLARAKKLSEEQGCTLFMTLMAVFDVMLYRLSGQEDFNVGSPIANRHFQQFENTLGFFVNTAVFRCQLNSGMSFIDLLQQVKNVAHKIYDNQDVPYELLVEKLNPARSGSLQPLFQLLFALQTAYEDISLIDEDNWVSRFDLQVTYSENENGLCGNWEYDKTLFNRSTVEQFVKIYEALLISILDNTATSIDAIPLLNKNVDLLSVINNELQPKAIEQDIVTLFEQQVENAPNKIAVYCDGDEVSYAELNNRANYFAKQLLDAGIEENELIGICLNRGIPTLVAILATLKAGGAYLAIDPNYPKERIDFIVQDSAISKMFVADVEAIKSRLTAQPEYIISVTQEFSANETFDNPQLNFSLPVTQRLAYMAYTSGTTGQPKGVKIPQSGVLRLVREANYCPLNSETRTIQYAPIAFDASTFEIWAPLLHGGSLVIYSSPIVDLLELEKLIKSHDVNTAWVTAGLLSQWMADSHGSDTGLSYLLTGGDVVSPVAVHNLYMRDKKVQCSNNYGPTENTTFSTHFIIPRDWPRDKSIPIGKNISNSLSYILDPALNPVPVGVIGELYLGGYGVATEYHNRPELTREKFVANPFDAHPLDAEGQSTLYRTGDLVRMSVNGEIQFLGRVDDQVKIRGFRIELDEVREAIESHPEIGQAFATVVEKENQGKSLVGYYRSTGDITPASLKQYLSKRLPDYMLPTYLVPVDTFKVNSNGKLDRNSLPSPFDFVLANEDIVTPSNSQEEQIWQIWSELLEKDNFGVTCDFFAIGGQSLLAIRMGALIQERLPVTVPLKHFFNAPTIQGLCEYIRLDQWASSDHIDSEADEDVEEGLI